MKKPSMMQGRWPRTSSRNKLILAFDCLPWEKGGSSACSVFFFGRGWAGNKSDCNVSLGVIFFSTTHLQDFTYLFVNYIYIHRSSSTTIDEGCVFENHPMVDSNEGPVNTEAEMSKQKLTVSVVSRLWTLIKCLIEFLELEVCNDIPAF